MKFMEDCLPITTNGSGIGDARNLETLNYKQDVLRVLPIPCYRQCLNEN